MEGCLFAAVRSLRHLTADEVATVLRQETSKLEVTKSLLSVLYNICVTKSIVLTDRFKDLFRNHTPAVLQLLEGVNQGVNRTSGIIGKKRILLKNLELVKLLAEVCPMPIRVPKGALQTPSLGE